MTIESIPVPEGVDLNEGALAPEKTVLVASAAGLNKGLEYAILPLDAVTAGALLGPDCFQEILFCTESGSVYSISQAADTRTTVCNIRTGRGHYLSAEDLENGVLELGQSFVHAGGNTSGLTQIVVVTAESYLAGKFDLSTLREIAGRYTNGNLTFIRMPAPETAAASDSASPFDTNSGVHDRDLLIPTPHGLARGRELPRISLAALALAAGSAGNRYQEIFFRTSADDLCAVKRVKDGRLVIVNSKTGAAAYLDEKYSALLELNRPYSGLGPGTAPLAQIVAMTETSFFNGPPDLQTTVALAKRETGGNVCFIKSDFLERLPKTKAKSPDPRRGQPKA